MRQKQKLIQSALNRPRDRTQVARITTAVSRPEIAGNIGVGTTANVDPDRFLGWRSDRGSHAGSIVSGVGISLGGRNADGVVDTAEACDDGNPDDGDGCSGCTVDDGWGCTGEPSVCFLDCNGNMVPDSQDIAECVDDPACDDCNGNDVPDECDIAGATSTDANENGVPDECDIVPLLPENSLGITDCTIDDDCANEATCVDGICYAPKHRYISIARNPEQVENTARRVSLVGGGTGPWWIDVPYLSGGLNFANLTDAPVYADVDFAGEWPEVVHVTGCEVATGQRYLVQAIQQGQDIGDEGRYSEPLDLHTPSVWGDVVSTCMNHDCQPPNGEVNIDDILAAIGGFQSLNLNPLTWFDLAPALNDGVPNQEVDIDDILANIQGFQSKPYPGLGPLNCP